MMTDNITYYTILDEDSSLERPVGVFRRVKRDNGQIDKRSSPATLNQEFSPLLYSAERGDTMYDFVPIGEEEASRIVERIRALADPGE